MKTLIRPRQRNVDLKTGEVQLWFDPDQSIAPDGRYHMMGGIFFPSNITDPDTRRNKIAGYALMAGWHKDTQTLYVFEEVEWYTTDHVLSPEDGAIEVVGLSDWLGMVWRNYYAHRYAFRQDEDTRLTYSLEFQRSPMIDPRPILMDAHWDDDAQPMNVVYRLNQLHRFFLRRSGSLYAELDRYRADPDAERHDYPAVHCLKCSAMVLNRFYSHR